MRAVVIGGSAAGMSAARTYHALDSCSQVTVISGEPFFYARCRLPEVLSGESGPEGIVYPWEAPADGSFNLIYGKALALDVNKKSVLLEDGQEISFDSLLLATGAAPARLGAEGEDLEGIYSLRYIACARAASEAASRARSAVVAGGGLVGLKCAVALKKRGVPVSVLVSGPGLLSRQMDAAGSAILEKELEGMGIKIFFCSSVSRFLPDDAGRAVKGLVLKDGRELEADLVMVGKGVRPNVGLLEEAGGAVGFGIKVDEFLRTGLPGIYAAGDCIEIADGVTGRTVPSGLWPLAVEQGRYAACNMAGLSRRYPKPLARMNSAQFGAAAVVSAGSLEGEEVYTRLQGSGKVYRRLAVSGGRLVGALLVGDVSNAGIYTALIKNRRPVSGKLIERLLGGGVCALDVMSNLSKGE